jgi:hypothetical protein
MNILNIKHMEIASVAEKEFTCSICSNTSAVEYKIEVNGSKEDTHHVCLNCHNQIAKHLFRQIKQRSFKY